MQDHGRNLCYGSTIPLNKIIICKKITMKNTFVCVLCVIKAVFIRVWFTQNKHKASIIHCLVISSFSNHYFIYLIFIVIYHFTILFLWQQWCSVYYCFLFIKIRYMVHYSISNRILWYIFTPGHANSIYLLITGLAHIYLLHRHKKVES